MVVEISDPGVFAWQGLGLEENLYFIEEIRTFQGPLVPELAQVSVSYTVIVS
jgi:hypothetical protein